MWRVGKDPARFGRGWGAGGGGMKKVPIKVSPDIQLALFEYGELQILSYI